MTDENSHGLKPVTNSMASPLFKGNLSHNLKNVIMYLISNVRKFNFNAFKSAPASVFPCFPDNKHCYKQSDKTLLAI